MYNKKELKKMVEHYQNSIVLTDNEIAVIKGCIRNGATAEQTCIALDLPYNKVAEIYKIFNHE